MSQLNVGDIDRTLRILAGQGMCPLYRLLGFATTSR